MGGAGPIGTGSHAPIAEESVMKIMVAAAAAAGFAIAVHLPPALACDRSSNAGISRTAENVSPDAPSGVPHYEWQYHYDHHAQWEGHWVLVK
jgi:hypothetical protein